MSRLHWVVLFGLAVFANPSPAAMAQFGGLFGSKTRIDEISATQLRKLQVEQAASEKQAAENGASVPSATFIVVDVRSPEEQAVSVLPGAITAEQFEKDRLSYAGRTVITYCTSGGRSERYARKLNDGGVPVKNFKGSILGWCDAGYPLETLQRVPTNKVHTYSPRNKVPSQYEAVP